MISRLDTTLQPRCRAPGRNSTRRDGDPGFKARGRNSTCAFTNKITRPVWRGKVPPQTQSWGAFGAPLPFLKAMHVSFPADILPELPPARMRRKSLVGSTTRTLQRLLSWARGMDSTCLRSGLGVRGRKEIPLPLELPGPTEQHGAEGIPLQVRPGAALVSLSCAEGIPLTNTVSVAPRAEGVPLTDTKSVCTPAPVTSFRICIARMSRHFLTSSVASSSHRALRSHNPWSCACLVLWC